MTEMSDERPRQQMGRYDNPELAVALHEHWSDGYDTAVAALRDMTKQLRDREAAEVVLMLATALESQKL
jgi:hypothetical protein